MNISDYGIKYIIPINILAVIGFGILFYTQAWHLLFLILLGYILLHGFGTVIGLHRLFSHNSFQTYRWVKRVLLILGVLSAQGSPLWWVANHRGLHHPHADQDKDLHTPKKGVWHSYINWQLQLKSNDVKLSYAKDLLQDPMFKFCHVNYDWIVWGSIATLALIDPVLCLYLLVIPQFLVFHMENLTNVAGHMPKWGYRNFDTNDCSTNNSILGILSLGDMFHNNHHAKPKSYTTAVRPLEVDLSGLAIKYLIPSWKRHE